MRPFITLIGVLCVLVMGLVASGDRFQPPASGSVGKKCPRGTVRAVIAGERTCLKAGQRCKRKLDRRYHHYGFHCHGKRLTRPTPPARPRFVTVEVTGPPEVVFDWTTDRCDDPDIPDLPARAFRDADGKVQLISTHYVGRRLIGADLDHLQRDCSVILRSGLDDDPAHFDDREWLSATWTPDGRTIYALIHEEYQGHLHPGRCPSGDYFKCWYNAVTLAVSRDTGRSYVDHPWPKLVASVPYRYEPDVGPTGMFAPSNIVRNGRDGYFYAFTWMQIGSRFGTCLMRTKNLSQPGSWRAWGSDSRFTMSFVDPYGPNPNPAAHVCQPVFGDPNSVTYNSVAHQWLGLIGAGEEGGFYYGVSTDLVSWTRARLFLPGESPTSYRCGDEDPILYPSLIDPSTTTRNFETSDGSAYVYYTRFHYQDCQQTLDRDLVRVPVRIRPS